MERTFRVSALPGRESSQANSAEVTLEELTVALTEYEEREQKDGNAWSPIVWRDNRRLGKSFETASCLVYDLDWDFEGLKKLGLVELHEQVPELTERLKKELFERLTSLGRFYIAHETYTAGRYRLVLPLAEDLTADNYQEYWFRGLEALGLSGKVDASGKDLARLFYLPSKPPGSKRGTHTGGSGLWSFEAKPKPAPQPQKSEVIDIAQIASEVRNPQLQGALDGTFKVPVGERHNFGLLWVRDLAEAPSVGPELEKILNVFRYLLANRAFEGADDSWNEEFLADVQRSFNHVAHDVRLKGTLSSTLKQAPKKIVTTEEARELSSSDGLGLVVGKDGNPKSTSFNVDLILTKHPEFAGHLRFNDLTRRPEISSGALFRPGPTGKNVFEGVYDTALVQWLEREFQLSVPRHVAAACLNLAARKSTYNPVQDYLLSLQWDGVPRVDNFLHEYCQCAGHDPYIRSISRKFLISAVARALEPGCKVDTVLVLRGVQGTKKTSLVKALAGDWYTTFSQRFDSKDGIIQATESWFVELSELASLTKSSIETMRGFITQRSDRIRIPYATYHEDFPRRCIFVGTTNSDRPLIDTEGNRRFWVVETGRVDIDELERNRDQIFAESVEFFRRFLEERDSGLTEKDMLYRWWLTPSEQESSDAENELYMGDDLIAEELRDWMADETQEKPISLTVKYVMKNVLRWPSERVHAEQEHGAQHRIRRALRDAGWVERTRTKPGPNKRVWELPSKEEAN